MRIYLFIVTTLCCFSFNAMANAVINIGVLSHRGDEETLKTWSPMAEYLSHVIVDRTFQIVPLDFNEIELAIKNKQVEFLIVNPSIYVTMEVRHRISRIATLNKLLSDSPYNIFGGVIFTRHDRLDINEISDLKRKTFMAVDKTSLGGYQMALRELLSSGINPYKDLADFKFAGIHDEVVNAVKNKLVDAGTVRTGILESMAARGEIKLEEFKIINEQKHEDFHALHSTRLYPEWPISKLRYTGNDLAQKVAIALLRMSSEGAGKNMHQYDGWTVPLEYQPVHDLLKELHLPPYENLGKFTLSDAIDKYWYLIVTTFTFLIITVLMTIWVIRLNHALNNSKKRLEKQYSLILESVADGIYGVDLDGNSTFVNCAMEKITGWKAKDLIGKNQHELLHHTRRDGSVHLPEECPVYETYKDDKPRYIADDLFWKVDGTSFPVEYTSTPLKDETHKTIGSVVVFRDISERKKAEEQERLHQAELAHVARLNTMGEMASGMAHELNQPLTAIATNADACVRMLESSAMNIDVMTDTLDLVGDQARRAGSIIQQLRQFVQKGQTTRSSVNINELIQDIIILVKHDLYSGFIQLKTILDPSLPQITVQPIQIEQVVLNLVRNAIESMSETENKNKLLTIRTGISSDNMLKVSVEDCGTGIESEVLEKLFTPYVTTKSTGMGLGLSISEGIILAHDGNMLAKNNETAGATFSFTLPLL